MVELPEGTVTFLFTDVEGSTGLLQLLGDRYQELLGDHHRLLRKEIKDAGGIEVGVEGDSFFVVFPSAPRAVSAAVAMQLALAIHSWPEGVDVSVRMGLHTGEGTVGADGYVGLDVHRAARIADAAHGGQILVSAATAGLVDDDTPGQTSLEDLGEHLLRDLARPETLFQVRHPDLRAQFPPLRTVEARTGNLPAELTSFVGRDRELAETAELLRDSRLLTLTGVGGCGKTRLALRVAAGATDEYPDGTWLVQLASLNDPELIPQVVADVLGIREQPQRSIIETVADVIREKTTLLVLDNCEHLLAASAGLATQLLEISPGLTVMATSREVLGAPGEVAYGVPSLDLPATDDKTSPAELHSFDSVRLFAERAEAVVPGFQTGRDNAEAVAEICRRLDGMPLAIELAAARLRVLSPSEIADRLDDRFRLLTGGSRAALPRQQTLQAAVDWSYELLSGSEQSLFNRLAVFAGGFTLEAAETVCAGDDIEPDVLDSLHGLVDRSMVLAEPYRGATRYRLLETMRHYAQNKMGEAGDAEAIRRRHAAYFLDMAVEAEPELWGRDQTEWMQRLETEHDNLRRALAWSLEAGETKTHLRMAGTLAPFWQNSGYWGEGRRWLAGALAATSGARSDARVKALLGAVPMFVPDDPKRAVAMAEEALELARELSDAALIAESLLLSGYTVLDRRERANPMLFEALRTFRELEDTGGIAESLKLLAIANGTAEPAQAMAWADESVGLFRQLGDLASIANSLDMAARIATDQGRYEQASRWLEESISISQGLAGNERGAHALRDLGDIARLRGDYERAATHLEESLFLFRQMGDRRCAAQALRVLGVVALRQSLLEEATASIKQAIQESDSVRDRRNVVFSLEALAEVEHLQERPRRAARLFAAAAAIRDARGMQLTPSERPDRERAIAAVRAGLERQAYDDEWSAGRGLSIDETVAYALEDDGPRSSASP